MKTLLFISLFIFGCTAEIPNDKYTPVVTQFSGVDKEFFDLVNDIRVSNNLQPLKGEMKLTQGCENHATYMSSVNALNHDYFWNRYTDSKANLFGEIVCYNYLTSASQVSAYQNSPNHNIVLINPEYTHIGIATVSGYQCVDFANYK